MQANLIVMTHKNVLNAIYAKKRPGHIHAQVLRLIIQCLLWQIE